MRADRWHVEALGDQAVLVSLPDESTALRYSDAVRRLDVSWLIDVVPAYVTVAVFFDLERVDHDAVVAALRGLPLLALGPIFP